jgi:hypothetical protein
MADGAWMRRSGLAGGNGTIGGHSVACITADLQLRHHLGITWDAKYVQDMQLLASRFGLPLPPAHSDSDLP